MTDRLYPARVMNKTHDAQHTFLTVKILGLRSCMNHEHRMSASRIDLLGVSVDDVIAVRLNSAGYVPGVIPARVSYTPSSSFARFQNRHVVGISINGVNYRTYWRPNHKITKPKKGDWIFVRKGKHDDHRTWTLVDSSGILNQEENDMSMSKDRVEIFLGSQYIRGGSNRGEDGYRKLAEACFGLSPSQFDQMSQANPDGFTIICRPSQFARFLIMRNEMGLTNDFKGLKPRLIPEVRIPEVINVAKNPHRPADGVPY